MNTNFYKAAYDDYMSLPPEGRPSMKAFCLERGISTSSFYKYSRRCGGGSSLRAPDLTVLPEPERSSLPNFVPLVVEGAPVGVSRVTVSLTNGVELSSPDGDIAKVVSTLQRILRP